MHVFWINISLIMQSFWTNSGAEEHEPKQQIKIEPKVSTNSALNNRPLIVLPITPHCLVGAWHFIHDILLDGQFQNCTPIQTRTCNQIDKDFTISRALKEVYTSLYFEASSYKMYSRYLCVVWISSHETGSKPNHLRSRSLNEIWTTWFYCLSTLSMDHIRHVILSTLLSLARRFESFGSTRLLWNFQYMFYYALIVHGNMICTICMVNLGNDIQLLYKTARNYCSLIDIGSELVWIIFKNFTFQTAY